MGARVDRRALIVEKCRLPSVQLGLCALVRRDIAADMVRAAGISGAAELFLRLILTEGERRLYLRVWRE